MAYFLIQRRISMLYRNLLIFTAISTYFLPTIAVKLTISSEKAQEIFYKRKSLFGYNNAYNECYSILGRDPSYPTYNCRIIAQHLHQAQKHFELAREYHKKERQAALLDLEIINNNIQTCLETQSTMEADKKSNPELNFAEIAADIRNAKRTLEDQKRKLEKKENLYTQSYWQTLSYREQADIRWALEDGKLSNKIDEEMERIEKDLKNKK